MARIDNLRRISHSSELIKMVRLVQNNDTPHGYMVVVEDEEAGVPASIFETLLWLKYVEVKSELDVLKVQVSGKEART